MLVKSADRITRSDLSVLQKNLRASPNHSGDIRSGAGSAAIAHPAPDPIDFRNLLDLLQYQYSHQIPRHAYHIDAIEVSVLELPTFELDHL